MQSDPTLKKLFILIKIYLKYKKIMWFIYFLIDIKISWELRHRAEPKVLRDQFKKKWWLWEKKNYMDSICKKLNIFMKEKIKYYL